MEKSHFDGTVLQLFGHSLLAGLLTAVTLGIGYPWALCMLQRWEARHTMIESKRLQFTGKGIQLLGMWIMLAIIPFAVLSTALFFIRHFAETKSGSMIVIFIFLALIIAAFFYTYFVRIQIKKWTIKHTEFEIHLILYSDEAGTQSTPVYTRPGPGQRPAPDPVYYQAFEKDWTEKIQPILPLVYVLWFCGITVGTFSLLWMIFK